MLLKHLKNQASEDRIAELEMKLKNERYEHGTEINWRDAELIRMKATVDNQLQEYCDLMDVKIKLDSQIATYRMLLESEESR